MQKKQLPAIVTRYAPTPSGFLHIGNVYSFLLTWLIARKNAGQILLRIDDLDRERVKMEYVEDIFRVLGWLGLDWDMGPRSVDEFQQRYSQVHRMQHYRQTLDILAEQQLAFACECSRKQLKEMGADLIYPETCKNKEIALDTPDVAWRLNTGMPAALDLNEYNQGKQKVELPPSQQYFIVKRRDGIPAYHLASLVDDVHFKVNFVVRGLDLYDSTVAQLYLAQKLNITSFEQATFFHHPLILEGSEKLSKSQKASSVLADFYPDKANLFRKLGSWMGLLPDQCSSAQEILRHFSESQFPRLSNPLA